MSTVRQRRYETGTKIEVGVMGAGSRRKDNGVYKFGYTPELCTKLQELFKLHISLYETDLYVAC